MGYPQEEGFQEFSILPCRGRQECPYDYGRNTDRHIEGMPFIEEDPRSCPKCGHICPEFMEAFGLNPRDLEIRALIHCGGLPDLLADLGEVERTSLS